MPAALTDAQKALEAYGFVYQMALAIPELRGYLTQASQGGWSPELLKGTIESSPWWRTHADTVRNLAITQATDPATYTATLNNAKNLLGLRAEQQGRSYNDAQLTQLALNTLTTNASFDTGVMDQLVASHLKLGIGEGDRRGGTAADMRNHMTTVAESYGVPTTSAYLDQWTTAIQVGHDSLAGFESLMRARAKAHYPQFADQIDGGMTVRDIADPYIRTMANTLEVPETSVTLKDNYVSKALTQRNPDGSATTQPLWQFEQTLKKDPRYAQTTQAKTDAYTTVNQIGKDWGFA